MGRTIDADRLKDLIELEGVCNPQGYTKEEIKQDFFSMIDRIPTVEPRSGEWKKADCGGYYCSECGAWKPMVSQIDYIADSDVNFCYGCGADMRGQRE